MNRARREKCRNYPRLQCVIASCYDYVLETDVTSSSFAFSRRSRPAQNEHVVSITSTRSADIPIIIFSSCAAGDTLPEAAHLIDRWRARRRRDVADVIGNDAFPRRDQIRNLIFVGWLSSETNEHMVTIIHKHACIVFDRKNVYCPNGIIMIIISREMASINVGYLSIVSQVEQQIVFPNDTVYKSIGLASSQTVTWSRADG